MDKPLIIFKMATGEQGAAAAMSHTGSLAGSHASYRAVFQRAGAIMVDDFEALMETAAFFAKAPPPRPGRGGGGRLGRRGDHGGGPGRTAWRADAAADAGRAGDPRNPRIPEFGSSRNPCDVTAQVLWRPGIAGRLRRRTAGRSAIRRAGVAADLWLRTVGEASASLQCLAEQHGKMACVVWQTEWQEGPALSMPQVRAGWRCSAR